MTQLMLLRREVHLGLFVFGNYAALMMLCFGKLIIVSSVENSMVLMTAITDDLQFVGVSTSSNDCSTKTTIVCVDRAKQAVEAGDYHFMIEVYVNSFTACHFS